VSLRNDIELANTRAKLTRAEARYQALRDETAGDEELREATMESLKRFINQLKEEIARYEICRRGEGRGGTHREGLKNDRELANTREKLRRLEEEYEHLRIAASDDQPTRRISMRSLKRTINQLKEEIARYEAHQPTRR
jgi:ribosomal protein L29